jgi:hypothetical protein
VDAPLGAAIGDGADAAVADELPAPPAAELLAAFVDAEFPHAASSSNAALPATAILVLRCIVNDPFDCVERRCGCRMRRVLSCGHESC